MKVDSSNPPDPSAGPSRPLQSVDWFGAVRPGRQDGEGPVATLLRTVVGVAAGLLVLLALGHTAVGIAIIGTSVLLGVASLTSIKARHRIAQAFAILGEWLGVAVSWVLLAPVFLVGFTMARGWLWLTRADPLQLRKEARHTYWLEADAAERKIRYASAMFASERLIRRGLSVPAMLGLLLAALVLSEMLLRAWGFGAPVLYVSDPQAGFYPAPNQVVDRYAGRIETNRYGMRSPDYPLVKPAGTFRILMIGDSTLYGGSYVDQQDLYSRRLEGLLRRAVGGRPVEVLAIGVNSWGPFHEIGYIEKFGTFDADLALVQLPTIDIYRPFHGVGEIPVHRVDNPPRLALEELAGHLAWRLRANISGPQSPQERDWHGRRGVEAYGRLARMIEAGGAEVMLNVLPSQPAGLDGPVPEEEARDVQRLRSAVAPLTVTYPAGLFSDVTGEAYHDGGHLDTAGHERYARYLRDSILGSSEAWARWSRSDAPAAAGRQTP